MALYLAVSLAPNETAFNNAVQRTIAASDRFRLQENRGWLIRSDRTSVELSNEIGVTNPENTPTPIGSAIIVTISSYYGRGPVDMWEWIKTRMEKK